jgi:hypothetical protein
MLRVFLMSAMTAQWYNISIEKQAKKEIFVGNI